MRTPTWEASAGALAAFFGTFAPLIKADAWTLTLADGTVLRWSGADAPLTFGGNTFALGPGVTRGQIKWREGISTDTLDVHLTDIVGTEINGVELPAFLLARGLDGAEIKLERLFLDLSATPVGALLWFLGDFEDGEGDRHEASITVASFTRRCEVSVPRDVYQTQCSNQVFDGRCLASRAAFTTTGAASSGTDSYRATFGISGLGKPDGWADLGKITMTSGPNTGIRRTCKRHTTTALTALQPWPFPVSPGETFSLQAGCDRMMATCDAKFANTVHFRIGTPFIPVPETVL